MLSGSVLGSARAIAAADGGQRRKQVTYMRFSALQTIVGKHVNGTRYRGTVTAFDRSLLRQRS